MKTVTDNLQETADEINGMLQTLLLNHSSLYQRNDHNGPVVFISAHGDYAYRELQEAGRQIQAKLLEEYRRFNSLIKTLHREQPEDVLNQLSEAETVMLRTIEQQRTWCKTTQEACESNRGATNSNHPSQKSLRSIHWRHFLRS